MTNAEDGISQLRDNVDTLIVIPNQKVMEVVNTKATLLEAFKIADSVLSKGTKAIADLITVPGLINLDFADIKTVMSNAGSALMGVGEAEGENKVQKAVEDAVNSPLIEVNIEGARGVLINVTGGPDITMAEIEEAAKTITERTAPDANIIFGATIDNDLKGKVKISVIATGFDSNRASLYQHMKKPQPVLISETSQLKKDLGIYRKELSFAQTNIVKKNVDKYNAKNGTSLFVRFNKVGEADLYTWNIENKSELKTEKVEQLDLFDSKKAEEFDKEPFEFSPEEDQDIRNTLDFVFGDDKASIKKWVDDLNAVTNNKELAEFLDRYCKLTKG